MNKLVFLILFFFSQNAFAQSTSFLQFVINYGNTAFELEKNYDKAGEQFQIDNLQFYVSDIHFYNNGKEIPANIQKYFLINAAYDSTNLIDYSIVEEAAFDEIKFNIGIDSLTNISGVYGGALDPTQGMYWTWQSGYINVKIEGSATNCPARKNKFQYHLGGYSYPTNTLQTVSLKTTNASMTNINMDLEQFLNRIDMSKTYEVMSPNAQAVNLAKQFSTIFTIDAD